MDGIVTRDTANGSLDAFVLCDLDETAFLLVSRSQTRLNDFAERHMVSGGRCFYHTTEGIDKAAHESPT